MSAINLQLSSLDTSHQTTDVCSAVHDDALQAIIDKQRAPVLNFFNHHLVPLISELPAPQSAADRKQLRHAFVIFERSTDGSQLLTPYKDLAKQLNLAETTRKTALRRCLKRGWICLPKGVPSRVQVAALEGTILTQMQTIRQKYQFRTGKSSQLSALIEEGLCPDTIALGITVELVV